MKNQNHPERRKMNKNLLSFLFFFRLRFFLSVSFLTASHRNFISLSLLRMILEAEIEGVLKIPFRNGNPVFPVRTQARTMYHNELLVDQVVSKTVYASNFQWFSCPAYDYWQPIFGKTQITHKMISGLCRFFSKILNIPCGREFYRRKRTSWWWMNHNILEVKEWCAKNKLKLTLRVYD